jgi:hypothetical protein
VDTKAELVDVYGRYHLRKEPLDTLERIQDAFMGATQEELRRLAVALFDLQKIQIFVVGDKNIKVRTPSGKEITMEEDLMALAEKFSLPYREIKLR